VEEKLAGQKTIKRLEHQRNEKRLALAKEQEAVDQEKDARSGKIQLSLHYNLSSQPIFTIHWRLI
jgi:adenine-specific DNA-methyltransferase